MKGQTKIIVFLILFFISIVLFSSTNLWGKGIIQQNIDLVKIQNTEKFIKDLDESIISLVNYDGTRKLDYNFDSPVQLLGSNIIEISFPSSVNIPAYWVNVTYGDRSYIREKMEGNYYRIQLVYPTNNDYRIELFSNGSTTSTPQHILLIKNDTYNFEGQTAIMLQVSFMK